MSCLSTIAILVLNCDDFGIPANIELRKIIDTHLRSLRFWTIEKVNFLDKSGDITHHTINEFRGQLTKVSNCFLKFRQVTGRLPATILLPATTESIDFSIGHIGEVLTAKVQNGKIISLEVWEPSQEWFDNLPTFRSGGTNTK